MLDYLVYLKLPQIWRQYQVRISLQSAVMNTTYDLISQFLPLHFIVFLDSGLSISLPILLMSVAVRWLTQYVFIQLTGNILPFGLVAA